MQFSSHFVCTLFSYPRLGSHLKQSQMSVDNPLFYYRWVSENGGTSLRFRYLDYLGTRNYQSHQSKPLLLNPTSLYSITTDDWRWLFLSYRNKRRHLLDYKLNISTQSFLFLTFTPVRLYFYDFSKEDHIVT